ncbi:putative hydrolase or acyltransferase [Salmonella enterica subsp. enterica]|uniref:Putative hydrolase or acyltransferase n=1 Tax=Salmonella enterica I TaxID=59201 RepID=A0A3S4IGY5_SALET|nr:putative hydrolase or acyltransferase [Salmonella enterica subsp. enterica]
MRPGWLNFYQNMHHPEQKDYWRTFLKGVWPMWTTPTSLAEEEVKKIHIPVLLLDGDRDEFFTVEEVTELYRLLPQAEMTLIPGKRSRHFPDARKNTAVLRISA